MRVALDAMGGDFGPRIIVEGAVLALDSYPQLTRLFLVGDKDVVTAELARLQCSDPRVEVVHASQVVSMGDEAVASVRKKKDSSVSRAVDLVKNGQAEAIVSAGHTGAAVAASTIKLRLLPGIERAGIAATIPTESNLFVLIDAGANPDAKPIHLLQYGIMGSVYSKRVLKYANPSIGLMSIGTEDNKGSESTKEVFKMLRSSGLNFRGNVEGHDLFENPVEVVLCEGFVGNVVLKCCEALAHAIFSWLRHELKKTPIRMAGAALASGAFQAIGKKTNADEYGGSLLLGVDGICIIAHGSSSKVAIKNAIRVALESIEHQINPHIVEEVKRYYAQSPGPKSPPNPLEAAGAQPWVSLLGTGSYAPKRVVTNAELEQLVETSDEWITSRTGIKERRIADKHEQTSDMAAEAARVALEQAGISAAQIDLILVATASPDMLFPATACLVQRKIGAHHAACMDISAACSGFLYSLELARQMIRGGGIQYALVIGAEKLSAFVDWKDRNTCVLFGDGAGATVLGARPEDRVGRGILSTYMGSDGEYGDILSLPGGGSRCPVDTNHSGEHLNTIQMQGKETFKQAVTSMTGAALEVLERTGLAVSDIACIIPHQANIRIIEAIADRLKVPLDRFFLNLERYGNTGAAAVAIALDEAHRAGRIKPGDKVLMIVFGSGLTWASSIVEW